MSVFSVVEIARVPLGYPPEDPPVIATDFLYGSDQEIKFNILLEAPSPSYTGDQNLTFNLEIPSTSYVAGSVNLTAQWDSGEVVGIIDNTTRMMLSILAI